MCNEAVRLLNIRRDRWYVDCTLGTGGHTEAILQRGGRVIGIDCDEEVISLAKERLKQFKDRVVFCNRNFIELPEIMRKNKIEKVWGTLYDLGVSSYQIEAEHRGFSFAKRSPLDMRMDLRGRVKADDLVNKKKEDELFRIIAEYGQEKRARAIAREIVRNRPIETTDELAKVIVKVYRGRRGRIHPATKTFQAIRIAVNDELENLKSSLEDAIGLLAEGGRIVVISFHSGEDRIVKERFRFWEKEGVFRILTKRPLVPSMEEIERNVRARSAKLRAGEKI
jgi:16S rRNA (cytosine1402-N4)-methyltransferase